VGLKEGSGICLRCGASIDLPGDRASLVGAKLPGGEPNPAALAPSRKRRAASSKGRATNSSAKRRKTTKAASTAGEAEA